MLGWLPSPQYPDKEVLIADLRARLAEAKRDLAKEQEPTEGGEKQEAQADTLDRVLVGRSQKVAQTKKRKRSPRSDKEGLRSLFKALRGRDDDKGSDGESEAEEDADEVFRGAPSRGTLGVIEKLSRNKPGMLANRGLRKMCEYLGPRLGGSWRATQTQCFQQSLRRTSAPSSSRGAQRKRQG